MSTTSWQIGTSYHDSNPYLKNTSNSSYGQWFGSSGPPSPPSLPHYGSLGSRAGRKIGFNSSTSDNRYSSLTSRDVQDIVSSTAYDNLKYSTYVPRYGTASGKSLSPSRTETDRISLADGDNNPFRRSTQPTSNTADIIDDLGLNDLKLSPRGPSGGTLSPLSATRSSTLPTGRRYDFLDTKGSGSTYDPLKCGLEKSRTSIGFNASQNGADSDLISAASKGNALERSNTFHGTYTPAPPSRPLEVSNIPTWRSRYHTPSFNTGSNLSERPITSSSAPADRAPLSIITTSSSLRSGPASPPVHQPSSPLFPGESSTSITPSSKASEFKSDFRPSRPLSESEEATVSNQIAITQTRPMYWLYGSRGRPNTPYKPSTYTYKSEEPLSSTYTSPSRMNETKEVGLGEIARAEYTRDLISGLPRQNSFSTGLDTGVTDYSSKSTEYSPYQYSPHIGNESAIGGIRYDSNISQPPPPGSPAKRSILKKTSSYSGASSGHYFTGGDDPRSHLPPLSSSGRKRVTFNSHQTYHPV